MAYKSLPKHGVKNVTTAGTQEPLVATAGTTIVRGLVIQAKSANTGNVYIGDENVSSSSFGVVLAAGEAVAITPEKIKGGETAPMDLNDVYIDVDTNGEGVTFLYQTQGSNSHTF